ncbi:hypothetical protein NHQ30_001675 [Ciborinia camelliae]|nr:hypothetical protein NHQ30_001675 [Ciborinia camelliae]
MKSQTLSALAVLATGLQLTAATGWLDMSSFSCPSNTNNECSKSQKSGWDFSDLTSGSFSSYNDFSFSGFTCSNSFGKRDNPKFPRRSSGKCISGTASSDYSSSPQFSCGGSSKSGSSGSESSSGISAFSISTLHVTTEFDCDLEFHYGMADGSTCKQKSSCSSSGSLISNSQCGGAKNVTVVYPTTGQTQPGAVGKGSCSVGISSIGFDCSTAATTQHPSTTVGIKTTSVMTTSSASSIYTSVESSSKTTLVYSSSEITSVQSTPSATGTSYTLVGTGSSKSSSIIETSVKPSSSAETSIIGTSVKPSSSAETSIIGTSIASSSVVSSPAVSSPAGSAATSIIGTYITGSSSIVQSTTDTIYSTSVSTIISCAESVTDCPARSTSLSTLIVPVSTSVGPATTEVPGSSAASSIIGTSVASSPAASSPESSAASIIGTYVGTAPISSGSATVSLPCVSSGVMLSGQTACAVTSESAPSSSGSVPSSKSSIIGTSVGTAPIPTGLTSLATTAYTTVIIQESTTICPVTLTHTTGGVTSFETTSTISTVHLSSTVISSSVITSVVVPTSAPSSAQGLTSAPIPSATSLATTAYTTVIIEESTTICPVTLTHTTGGVTSFETTSTTSTVHLSSTIVSSGVITVTPPASAVEGVTTTSTGSVPTVTAACPDVLPQCLNTWMFSVGCDSNTDSNCYCPDDSFVKNVFACLSAHAASSSEIDAAQKYFQGICAAHVSGNPAIVTAASTVDIPAGSSAIATTSAPDNAYTPVTTITLNATLVVPCTDATGVLSGSDIPTSYTTTTLSTAVIVPQVAFYTAPPSGTETPNVALIAGTTPASQAAGYTTSIPSSTAVSGVAGATNVPPAATASASTVLFANSGDKTTSGLGGLIAAALLAIFAL